MPSASALICTSSDYRKSFVEAPTTKCELTVDRLPFAVDIDIALAIATKTVLDEMTAEVDGTQEMRAHARQEYGQGQMDYGVNVSADILTVFELFDAILAGIESLSDVDYPNKQQWQDAAAYLARRR